MTNNTAALLAKVVNNNDTNGLLRSILDENNDGPKVIKSETIAMTTNVTWDDENDDVQFTAEDVESVKAALADFIEGLGIIGGEVTLNITHTI